MASTRSVSRRRRGVVHEVRPARRAAPRSCSASARRMPALMFVGEGPGAAGGSQGEPFVGRAGQLLTQLIEGIGLTRDDVYIANVVKCRPPGNRDPLPTRSRRAARGSTGSSTLIAPAVDRDARQLRHEAAARHQERASRKLRGQEFPFRRAGITAVLVPTLHPAAVLRSGGKALAEAARRLRERSSGWSSTDCVMQA